MGDVMISLLIYVLILCLVFGVIYYVITLLPLPPPFGLIVQVILALILVLVLLDLLLGEEVHWLGSPETSVTTLAPATRGWRRRGLPAAVHAKTRLFVPPSRLLSVWASSQICSWHQSIAFMREGGE